MTLAGGVIKDFSIEPEPPVDNDRIPVTDAHRRGVLDPMTGSMLRVAGTGDPLSPESCRAATPMFDGRMRYDLRFEFKRMETVQAEKGYRGPALVCAIYFTPISGYIPDRAAIKYLIAQRDMEVWLVPIAGTRVLVPFKLKIPTPVGSAVLEATQFVTSAPRRRARPPRPNKTQSSTGPTCFRAPRSLAAQEAWNHVDSGSVHRTHGFDLMIARTDAARGPLFPDLGEI